MAADPRLAPVRKLRKYDYISFELLDLHEKSNQILCRAHNFQFFVRVNHLKENMVPLRVDPSQQYSHARHDATVLKTTVDRLAPLRLLLSCHNFYRT